MPNTEPTASGSFQYPKILMILEEILSVRDAETTSYFRTGTGLDGFDITSITSSTDTESTRITDVDLTQFCTLTRLDQRKWMLQLKKFVSLLLLIVICV